MVFINSSRKIFILLFLFFKFFFLFTFMHDKSADICNKRIFEKFETKRKKIVTHKLNEWGEGEKTTANYFKLRQVYEYIYRICMPNDITPFSAGVIYFDKNQTRIKSCGSFKLQKVKTMEFEK